MSQYTQENRSISLSTSLGKDKLLLTAFQGSEHISDLFEFQLEALSEDLDIKADQLLGKQVTVTIHNEFKRTFNGYVSRFSFGEIQANNLRQYRLTIVPWLWFLSKTHNHRIFQEKSAKDIITQVFSETGFNDYDFKTSGANEVREYCVQYNESDLNFVSRLLEEEGIAYYFEQLGDMHKLVIVDQKNAYKSCDESEVTYSKGNQPDTQINKWDHLYEFITGKWEHRDYDFKNPKKVLKAVEETRIQLPLIDQFEHYEYPGNFTRDAVGKDYIKYRLEAEEAGFDTVLAQSNCSTFYSGGTFKMKQHDAKGEKGGYIITSISHNAYESSYFTGSASQSGYSNRFICIPIDVHFRPLRTHLKPLVNGPQSAVVTGPSGEEIFIDEYGRIKVQFFWDRDGLLNESTTCFIRVVQPWAGKKWGTSFIPRMGMEVIVDFINGDPDRPIVTGSVYNENNMPPYTSKTQSGIKTHSTKGGGESNYNELRFEDLKGSEQIYIHAEKNLDTKVENNETLKVDKNRTKIVGVNETSSIGKNRDKSVGENQTETIGKDKTITVGDNHQEAIGADKTLEVGKDHNETIGNNMTITVGSNLVESVGKHYNCDIGKTVTFTAGDEIVLKTGSASITMKKNGDITIKGKNIVLKGSGKIDVKASGAVTIKGSSVSVN